MFKTPVPTKEEEKQIVYDILGHYYPNSLSYGGHGLRRDEKELPVIKKYLSGVVKTKKVKSADGRGLLLEIKKRPKWPKELILGLLIEERDALSSQLDEVYTHIKMLQNVL